MLFRSHVIVCCSGRASSYLAAASMLLGLHVRVGMEDTPWVWPHKDDLITNNAKMFTMFKQMAQMLGREVYTRLNIGKSCRLPRDKGSAAGAKTLAARKGERDGKRI